jgi:hypothetical protein
MVALNSAEQVWLISLCATLVANAYLEAEIERSTEAISTGFARGRLCKPSTKSHSACC